MNAEQLLGVVDEGRIHIEVAKGYLTLYIGEDDSWASIINKTYSQLNQAQKDDFRIKIAYAILLPAFDRSVKVDPDNPVDHWHKVMNGYYKSQFDQRDWLSEFKQVVKRDIDIQTWRNQALGLGVIDPIEYQPYTRQAFNWMYERAKESGDLTDKNKDEVARRLKNIVLAYGGAVISNIFTRHKDRVDSLLNWRTGYFIERAVFNVYTPEQVLRIKKQELNETNSKLVKKLRIN